MEKIISWQEDVAISAWQFYDQPSHEHNIAMRFPYIKTNSLSLTKKSRDTLSRPRLFCKHTQKQQSFSQSQNQERRSCPVRRFEPDDVFMRFQKVENRSSLFIKFLKKRKQSSEIVLKKRGHKLRTKVQTKLAKKEQIRIKSHSSLKIKSNSISILPALRA